MNRQIPDVGETIPEFTIQDSDHNPFSLSEALKETTYLLLAFYRGHW